MKKMTLKYFTGKSHINEKLIRSVVKQIGGYDNFAEYANDVTNHGADGGFSGFIYYNDTLAFTKRNKKLILELAEEQANDLGESLLGMIKNFGVFRNDPISENEVARVIYTGKGDRSTDVLNVLAWYALEEVCRSYTDILEG